MVSSSNTAGREGEQSASQTGCTLWDPPSCKRCTKSKDTLGFTEGKLASLLQFLFCLPRNCSPNSALNVREMQDIFTYSLLFDHTSGMDSQSFFPSSISRGCICSPFLLPTGNSSTIISPLRCLLLDEAFQFLSLLTQYYSLSRV